MSAKGKILIVDDSAIQREILKHAIEGGGYDAILAGSGLDGIALAYQESPDVIVSDVIMPEISGYHLCRFVKSDALIKTTPVILMTSAAVQKQDRFWGLKSGADAYIDKDDDPTALLNKIDELIRTRPRHGTFTPGGAQSMVQRSSPQQIKSYLNFLFDKLLFESTLSNEIRELGRFVHNREELLKEFVGLVDSFVGYSMIGVAIMGTAKPYLLLSLNETVGFGAVRKVLIELARKARAPKLSTVVRRSTDELFDTEHCDLLMVPSDAYQAEAKAFSQGACPSFPLRFRDEELGAVAILAADSGELGEDALASLQLAIREFAPIVRTMIYYEETRRLSVLDALTGIFNRRHFLDVLDMEYQRYRRYRQCAALIMFDLDGFKPINDFHGHLAGDALLKDIAQIVRNSVREVDVAARYGGDEFVILLPETGLKGALLVAERLRANVEAYRLERDGEELMVTGSFGVSVTSSLCNGPSDVIAGADKALYEAKETGRNRICANPPDLDACEECH